MDVLESLRHTALAGADAETLMSYAKLMGSVTKSIDTLNKINLQKRKENITREMKKLEQEGPPQIKDSTTNIQNQTVYVTTREDIMKSLLDQAGKIVDTTVFVEGQDPGYISDSSRRP